MAKIKIKNVTLAYEIIGEGTPIVITPGLFVPRDNWGYLQAGYFSKHHKVLLWDRRNTGASDICIEEAVSEWHLWADDLHELLHSLDMSPAYLAGGSSGSVFSLLMAYRYPQDVKALILHNTPTNNVEFFNAVTYARYIKFAELAETEGMKSVIDFSTEAWIRQISRESDPNDLDMIFSWIAEAIAANPGNYERLLSLNPNQFATHLRKLVSWNQIDRFHLAQLTDEEISHITIPSLVLHGLEELHPRDCAEDLHKHLPNSTWVEYTDWYEQSQIEEVCKSDVFTTQKVALTLPIVEKFLSEIEA